MSPELDNKLCEKYPLIFAERHMSMMQTCMCWGFDCGDGWYNIIDVLCNTIQGYIDWHNTRYDKELKCMVPIPESDPNYVQQVVTTQVKEKFGTLRFYCNGGDQYIDGMISMAESLSSCTCERCGNPGKSLGGGWITTLCKDHAEELGLNYDIPDETF